MKVYLKITSEFSNNWDIIIGKTSENECCTSQITHLKRAKVIIF